MPDLLLLMLLAPVALGQLAGHAVARLLHGRIGWFADLLGVGLATSVPLAMTSTLMQAHTSEPCPAGYEVSCGEGVGYIAVCGMSCTCANLAVATALWWLRAATKPPTPPGG